MKSPQRSEGQLRASHTGPVRGALLLPGGDLLSWGDDGTLRIWDLTTGACRQVLGGHASRFLGSLVLPDGGVLSWDVDGTLMVWEVATGACRQTLAGHEDDGGVHGVELLPDGGVLSWGKCTLDVWDLATGACRRILKEHMAQHIRPEPGRDFLDQEIALETLKEEFCIHGVFLQPGGGAVSWNYYGTLKEWDLRTGACLASLRMGADMLTMDGALALPDRHVLTCGDCLRVWSPATGECRPLKGSGSLYVYGALVLPSGEVLSWGFSGMHVWDLVTGGCRHAVDKQTDGALLRPDGIVMSWSWQDPELNAAPTMISAWDLVTGECQAGFEGHEDWVNGVLLLPDHRMVSWSEDHTLRVWNLENGKGELLCLGIPQAPEEQGEEREDHEQRDEQEEMASDGDEETAPVPPGSTRAGSVRDRPRPSGDMLVDFLILAGVWPNDLDPHDCPDEPLPAPVLKASKRLFKALESNPEWWLEIPPELGNACHIVNDDDRDGTLSIAQLARLPGLEDYPWHKRGPLWYSSNISINRWSDGPVLFLRDGWVGFDPSNPERFTVHPWDKFQNHEWPGTPEDGKPSKHCIVLGDVQLESDEGRPWAALSMRLADILLRRILPAAGKYAGARGMRTPPIGHWSEQSIRAILTGGP